MKPNAHTAAICGLFCGICPCYPNDCHGCLSDKLAGHCASCPNGFRECARHHAVTRCNECGEFPCAQLKHFSGQHWENGICHHAEVIQNLTQMNESGVEQWVEMQTKEHTCHSCGKLIPWYEHACPWCAL